MVVQSVKKRQTKSTSNFIEEYPSSVTGTDCVRLIQLFESNLKLQTVGVSTVGFDPKIKDDKEISLTKDLEDKKEQKYLADYGFNLFQAWRPKKH